jgi:hypothetical protein
VGADAGVVASEAKRITPVAIDIVKFGTTIRIRQTSHNVVLKKSRPSGMMALAAEGRALAALDQPIVLHVER